MSFGKYNVAPAQEFNQKLQDKWSPEQISEKRRVEVKLLFCFKRSTDSSTQVLTAGDVKVLRHKGKRQKPIEPRECFLTNTPISEDPVHNLLYVSKARAF